MKHFKITLCVFMSLTIIIFILNNLEIFKNLNFGFNKKLKLTNTIENEEDDEEDFTASEETMDIIDGLHSKLLDSNKVYIDINIDDNKLGKLVFELNNKVVPKTCKNFIDLCKNKAYKNVKFHRLVKDFCLQGGDITKNDGSGGISIYGNSFDDENFQLNHDNIGVISMANKGPNTNNSQFFITLKSSPFLNGKHVAFGKIISGIELLKKINELNTDQEKPINDIYISDCGVY